MEIYEKKLSYEIKIIHLAELTRNVTYGATTISAQSN